MGENVDPTARHGSNVHGNNVHVKNINERQSRSVTSSARGGGGAIDRAKRDEQQPAQRTISSSDDFDYNYSNFGSNSSSDGESSDGGSDDSTESDFNEISVISNDKANLNSSQVPSSTSSNTRPGGGGESYSQPLRTLKKLQSMLDETDYAITSPNSPRLKTSASIESSSTTNKDGNSQTKSNFSSEKEQDLASIDESYDDTEIPTTLWSSKDRGKYKRQQQLQRRYNDIKTQKNNHEEYTNDDYKSTGHGGEDTDSENGMDYTLPNLPIYFSDTEPIESEPNFQAQTSLKSSSTSQSKPTTRLNDAAMHDVKKEQNSPLENDGRKNTDFVQRPNTEPFSPPDGRYYPSNFFHQSSPYPPQGQASPAENLYGRQYYPQQQHQQPPYYPPPYPYQQQQQQQQTTYQGYQAPPSRQVYPMYPSTQTYGPQMIYPGSSSVSYPPGMYPMTTMQGPVQHMPYPSTMYSRSTAPKDMPRSDSVRPVYPTVHSNEIPKTPTLSKSNVELEAPESVSSRIRITSTARNLSFDSIQKLITMTFGVAFISFCAVSPRSLRVVEYSNKMRKNIQIIGCSFIAPLVVLLLVVNRNENDVDSIIKTLYHSAMTGYGVALFLEVSFTTIARLLVFRFMEPGIFNLTPKVPLILLPWTLREYSYRPKRITLFAADFISSCLVSPMVEEWIKFTIMQAVSELPKNFTLTRRKMSKKKRNTKRKGGPTLELIPRETGEKQVTCINPYISQMLASSIGLKLGENIRRVMMYTKTDHAHKGFYAFMRGVYPIHELCGTLTALQLSRRDVLGLPIPTWKILLPAVVLHGMANFRGMKPLFKWISSTPWSEMQMTPITSMNDILHFQIGNKTLSQVMWLIILGRVLGYCIKNYYMVCRQSIKRTTTYASNQAAFSAELEAADLLKIKKKQGEK